MDCERQFDKCIDERDVARSQLTMAEREVEIAAEQCCGLEDQLAALREELEKAKKLLGQARSMVNGATDEWHTEVQKIIEKK